MPDQESANEKSSAVHKHIFMPKKFAHQMPLLQQTLVKQHKHCFQIYCTTLQSCQVVHFKKRTSFLF